MGSRSVGGTAVSGEELMGVQDPRISCAGEQVIKLIKYIIRWVLLLNIELTTLIIATSLAGCQARSGDNNSFRFT